jgi:hypothetical protein
MNQFEFEHNKEYRGGGPIDVLKRKKLAKPQPVFIVRLKKGIVQDKGDQRMSDYMDEEQALIEKLGYDPNPPPEKITSSIPGIIFKDKRRDHDVNRDLIMARLNKHVNVKIVEKNAERRRHEEFDSEPFKIPLIDGRQYGVAEEGEVTPEPIGKKIKKTFTFQEKIGKEMEKGLEYEEELPDVLDNIEEIADKAEKELLEEIREQEEAIIKGPVVIKFKPKRGKKKEKVEEGEKGEEEKGEPEKPEENEPVEEEGEAEAEEPGKPGKKKATRKVYEDYRFGDIVIGKNVKIGKKALVARLPKREKFVLKTSDFYMNNRKLYIQKIAELFKPYKKEILDSTDKASCDASTKIDFKLMTHQKVVRDYLNLYTPYRGLLLYHMLGSGKTCTSIAIAEGMKSEKPIVLMTPASLKMNFFSELKKCGDVMYKKNQYWEFVSTDGKPDYVNILANALQIPTDYIQRKKGAWLVDITKKKSNFTELETSQQKDLDEQIDLMIRAKYLDINYNGLNTKAWERLTENGGKNPFDNSTVLIDEAHNFVSRIVNKVKKPDSLSYKLYHALMSATNVKIVLISGTPIINYPNELGILFNILRGYIKQWTFQLRIKSDAPAGFKLTRDEILKFFDKERLLTYDYVEYSGNKLMVTRNPYGFINTKKSKQRGGDDDDDEKKPYGRISGMFSSLFGGKSKKPKKHIKTRKESMPSTSHKNKTKKHREHDSDEAESKFYVEDGVVKQRKTKDAEEEELAPEETAEYNERIFHDLHKGGESGPMDEYAGVRLDETGNITDEEFVKQIRRILNKNHVEIVDSGSSFSELKALPDDSESFLNMFVDKDDVKMKNENTFKKRILGLSSYFRSAEEKLMPSFVKTEKGDNYHIVPVELSNYQFTQYEKIRAEETKEATQNKTKKQKLAKKGMDDLYNISSTYRIFSRAVCNFAFPNPPGRPMPDNSGDNELDEADIDGVSPKSLPDINEFMTEEDANEKMESVGEPTTYQSRIKAAMKQLEYDPSKASQDQFLTPDGLARYSPKFMKILENIQDEENYGLHLLYSQFRTIEGIGIIKLVLESNGFAEFKIRKSESTGMWEIVEKEEDAGKPRFVLYTGTETPEEKEIIRNIYNSVWEMVPSSITEKLREISSNNFYGEIIKLFMITSSGAEGISLRNTRYVHIVEPYWHMVRIDQVIGRARRICSHQDLPEELRTVKVFLYLSVFSNEQKTNQKSIELMNRDTSMVDGRPITTDESLFETALFKRNINNQLLDAIKETAIDCSLYNTSNKDENLVCYGYGKVTSNAFASYPTLQQDLGELDDANVKKTKLKLKASKPIDGVIYAVNPQTLEAYDMKSYEEALKGTGELILLGKISKEGKSYVLNKI